MLLDMLVLLDSILQMQLLQINQSEDSSKITIMSDTTYGQLHQRSIASASNYNRITLLCDKCYNTSPSLWETPKSGATGLWYTGCYMNEEDACLQVHKVT